MSRRTKRFALETLIKMGPWTAGSAHGYHENDDCDLVLAHAPDGKYGQGYHHCLFCKEDIPYHKEYCAWNDYFTENTSDETEVDGW